MAAAGSSRPRVHPFKIWKILYVTSRAANDKSRWYERLSATSAIVCIELTKQRVVAKTSAFGAVMHPREPNNGHVTPVIVSRWNNKSLDSESMFESRFVNACVGRYFPPIDAAHHIGRVPHGDESAYAVSCD
jgi:hypothetical protein